MSRRNQVVALAILALVVVAAGWLIIRGYLPAWRGRMMYERANAAYVAFDYVQAEKLGLAAAEEFQSSAFQRPGAMAVPYGSRDRRPVSKVSIPQPTSICERRKRQQILIALQKSGQRCNR
jgi:hypothetical protein